MQYMDTYRLWQEKLAGTPYADQLLEMNEQEIQDSFFGDLEFGTAGMRGILSLGTNRMNVFTVRRCTQGLADYLNQKGFKKGVAIAYDSRNMSAEFARETALVLAKNGIPAFLYTTPHSVPQLSFTILELGCDAGVVITASHNPPAYNGYKVYGSDGGQMAVEDAAAVTSYIEAVDDLFAIQPLEEGAARDAGLLHDLGSEVDDRYFSRVKSLLLDPDTLREQARALKVVYTPLFGTGNVPVRRILKDIGVEQLYVVEAQSQPNGDFPGLSAPNPENREVFTLAFDLANQVGADLVLATDPDSDRLGVAVRNGQGQFEILTGNQIGCLLLEFILSHQGPVQDGFVVRSIVSTTMADAIAARYGVEMRAVLTGFKFIAEQIKNSLKSGKGHFLFGFEESYGFLSGDFVRDKDAIMASMLTVEAAADYLEQGKTLYDGLQELYEAYGYYQEEVISLSLSGAEGIQKIKNAVAQLREHPLEKLGPHIITCVSDYLTQQKRDLVTGQTELITLPKSDVLCYAFEGGRVLLRPSGTEPKLKAYVSFHSKEPDEAKEQVKDLVSLVHQIMEDITR